MAAGIIWFDHGVSDADSDEAGSGCPGLSGHPSDSRTEFLYL